MTFARYALLSGAGAASFALIALLAVTGASDPADHAIMLYLRDAGDGGSPDGPPWLVQTVIDITALGGYPVLITWTIAASAILVTSGKGRYAVFLIASTASGTLVTHSLKLLFSRERPDLLEHLLDTHTASFPSGHAAMSAIFYIALATILARLVPVYRGRVAILMVGILLALTVGVSRIWLGVHWPSDVLAGWAVAAFWLGICLMLLDRADERTAAGSA